MTSPTHIERSALRAASPATAAHISRENAFGARNYDPLPVVLAQGAGAWLTDVDGRRYLDLMSAYSAVSFGHAHPKIVAALIAQAQQLAVTSRAFHNDRLPALLERLAQMSGLDRGVREQFPRAFDCDRRLLVRATIP
jgi:ornithine--oxo-acid transaminase